MIRTHLLLASPVLLALACNSEGPSTRQAAQSQVVEGSIGIAECDAYLAQYRTCAEANVPTHQQNQVFSGIDRRKSQWVKLATSDVKKEALRRVCKDAIETAKEELPKKGWNCAWVETDCGNGTVEIGEGCDDGGNVDGDGCDAGCFEEDGSSTGGGTGGGSQGTGGSGTGGPPPVSVPCNSAGSADLGSPGSTVSVANDACLKVEGGYPGWWGTRGMKFSNEAGGNLPVAFDWSSECAPGSGSDSFTGDWQNINFGPTSDACPTFIKLKGDGAAQIRVKYFAN